MEKVVLESPYGAPTAEGVQKNVEYAKACMRDCFERGEAAIASHLLYTQVLDDKVEKERELGIQAGFTWNRSADKIVVYTDHGISRGMEQGIAFAKRYLIPIEYRKLYSNEEKNTTI